MIAFSTVADPHTVVSKLRLITPAVSLGSVDTLIEHPAALTHRLVDGEELRDCGVSANLLRLSVGLEDVEDLWDDLDAARSEEHTSELQSRENLVCRLLL